jgi:hypothetical protein
MSLSTKRKLDPDTVMKEAAVRLLERIASVKVV